MKSCATQLITHIRIIFTPFSRGLLRRRSIVCVVFSRLFLKDLFEIAKILQFSIRILTFWCSCLGILRIHDVCWMLLESCRFVVSSLKFTSGVLWSIYLSPTFSTVPRETILPCSIFAPSIVKLACCSWQKWCWLFSGGCCAGLFLAVISIFYLQKPVLSSYLSIFLFMPAIN